MVIDTSAIIAVAGKEDGYQNIISAMLSSPRRCISSASVLEVYMVTLGRMGADAWPDIENFIEAKLDIVSVSEEVLTHAIEGYRRYGKGRHPAKLNYGDCFAYGTAKALNFPLLFVGNDFSQTDIASAL